MKFLSTKNKSDAYPSCEYDSSYEQRSISAGAPCSKRLKESNPSAVPDIYRKVRILKFSTRIDSVPTKIDESSQAVLKYKTPDFRAQATVQMGPLAEGEMWKVGWIQACTDMLFQNFYGKDGYTSWEFPELLSGKQPMISDCDGRHYPWYGSGEETVIFEGPSDVCQEATVKMNDNFHPHVTWRNPADSKQSEPNLTSVVRDQSFCVWLVAWNMSDLKSYILKTIKWTMKLTICVNPSNPLGHRAKLTSDPVPTQPIVLDKNIPIPKCALMPPNANSAQMLVWRAIHGTPVVVIPPVWNEKNRSDMHRKTDSRL